MLDNLLKRLEKYTNNTEELIEIKIKEVAAEKEKTDRLILRILPALVSFLSLCRVMAAIGFSSKGIFLI